MDSNNYHWSSEKATLRRGGVKHDVDAVTLLASRVDALAQTLDRIGISPTPNNYAILAGIYAVCETCSVQGHTSADCFNGPFFIEHDNAVHNFNSTPQNNSYLNAQGLGWRSHPNSLYKNPNHLSQHTMQPSGFQYKALYTPPLPPPQPTSHLESLMKRFIAT